MSDQVPSPTMESILMPNTMDVLLGHKTFDLKVVSWRQFRYGASYGGGRHTDFDCLDDLRIEVCCRPVSNLRASKATVDENPRQDLDELIFTIELHSAEKRFASLDAVPYARHQKELQGYLRYFGPIEAGNTYDGKAEPGSVNGMVFFGADTIREIAHTLTFHPEQEIRICPTVRATREPSENAMIYDPGGPYDRTTYHWSGKEWLYVTEVLVITASAPAPKVAEVEAEEDEPPAELPKTRPQSVGVLLWSLFVAWLVYETSMSIGSTGAAFTWDAGSLGSTRWPAGSLGPGSQGALWLGSLAFMFCPRIAFIVRQLLRSTEDQKAIRVHLMAIALWLRRQDRPSQAGASILSGSARHSPRCGAS